VRSDLTGCEEYIGNKIDLQTNIFHGLIMKNNVPLLVRHGRDDWGGEGTHYPWSV
jgi:hypothetical protein